MMKGSLHFYTADSYNGFLRAVAETGFYTMSMPVPFIDALMAISEQMATLSEQKRLTALKAYTQKKDLIQLGQMAEFGIRTCQLRPAEAVVFKEYLINNADILRQMNMFIQLRKFCAIQV